ncbi:MAG: HD domain-containing protein [Blastocatellia bacterium]|nr:HD domain-containing protein [Blastocatellia bacterium]
MAHKVQKTKILYIILAVVLSLAIVPLILVVWQLVDINRTAMSGSERRSQLFTIQDVSNQVESYVSLHRDAIVKIAQTFEVTSSTTALPQTTQAERGERLGGFLKKDPSLILLAVVPLEGGGEANATGSGALVADGQRISNAENSKIVQQTISFFRQHPKKTYTSEPFTLPSSLEFAIAFAQPMQFQNNATEAVIAVVSLEPVYRFVSQLGKTGKNSALLKEGNRVVFLVNAQGRILIHPDREMVYSKPDVSNWGIVKRWMNESPLATTAEQFELNLDNEDMSMLGSFTSTTISPEIRLGVIAVINEKMAYSSISLMIWQAVKVSAIFIVIAVAVGFVLTRWVTLPIEALAGGARAIAAGDFSKRIKVRTHTEIGQLGEDFNSMAEQIQHYISDLKFAANENRQLFLGTVHALAEAIDGKDPYTRGHSERVMLYSVLIAEFMGMNPDEIEDIRIASILHDVGKIGIEDRILKKPAALTEDEYTVMKQHPQKGANIMSQIPQMKKYVPGMYYHHECMDGKGYPLGLKGDQIPMMARIISVADTFDAMTTNRPYQRAMDPDFAVSRIYTFSGTRYDPVVVKALDDSLKAGRLNEVLRGYQERLEAGKQ